MHKQVQMPKTFPGLNDAVFSLRQDKDVCGGVQVVIFQNKSSEKIVFYCV